MGMARRCFFIPNELAAYISETEHPQGIFAVGEMPKAEPLTMRAGSYLLLDELQDPGNLGTILRTAEAMGITAVVLSAHCPDLFSPKVIRSTMGSGWRQKTVRVDDLAGSIAAWQKQGLHCYAATLSPEALPLQRLPAGECRGIVIGNEGNGVSREVIDACNGEVYIPMRGAAESLNAAAAAALCMWELSGRGICPDKQEAGGAAEWARSARSEAEGRSETKWSLCRRNRRPGTKDKKKGGGARWQFRTGCGSSWRMALER